MCICYEWNDGVMFAKITDEFNVDIALQHLYAINRLHGEISIYKKFVDFSDCCSAKLSAYEIIDLSRRCAGIYEKFKKFFVAVYAPSDYLYGMGRMFQVYAMPYYNRGSIEIFRDKDQALDWLTQCV